MNYNQQQEAIRNERAAKRKAFFNAPRHLTYNPLNYNEQQATLRRARHSNYNEQQVAL